MVQREGEVVEGKRNLMMATIHVVTGKRNMMMAKIHVITRFKSSNL